MNKIKRLRKKRKRVSRRAKRGTHISLKGGTFNYRSEWELKFAMWLDVNTDVASYRYEPYAVSYVSNVKTGKLRKYYPDFEVTMIDGSVKLVEIKPKRKMTQLRNVKKFAAASSMCALKGIAFQVVTEVELKALGLM